MTMKTLAIAASTAFCLSFAGPASAHIELNIDGKEIEEMSDEELAEVLGKNQALYLAKRGRARRTAQRLEEASAEEASWEAARLAHSLCEAELQ